MNLFDRLIDAFSAKELKKRVWVVVCFGLLICAIAAIAGRTFLEKTYSVSIDGAGIISSAEDQQIEITLNKDEFQRLKLAHGLGVKIKLPSGTTQTSQASLISVDPETGSIILRVEKGLQNVPAETHFNVSLILFEKPFWKLLWGN